MKAHKEYKDLKDMTLKKVISMRIRKRTKKLSGKK